MRSKKGLIVALVFVILIVSAFVYVKSYYPMGGEVIIVAKKHSYDYFITVEQGTSGDAGWGQFKLKCTKEQFDSVEVGDIVHCDRTQSALTHRGTVHSIRRLPAYRLFK